MGSSFKKLLLAAVGVLLLSGGVHAAEWYEKIEVGGDLRHRFEYISSELYHGDTAGDMVLADTLATRYRNRVRGRLSVKASPADNLEIGLRLASGSEDPVSTNQTFDGAFTTKGIHLDRAYFKWSIVDGLYLEGGKYGIPWHLASNSFWDGDLAVEGATVGWDRDFGAFSPFASFNYLWVDEIKDDPDDVMLYLGQGGATFTFGGNKLTLSASYSTYTNIAGHQWLLGESFGNTEGEELEIDTSYSVDPIDPTDTTWNYDSTYVGTGGYAYSYDVIQPGISFSLGAIPLSIWGEMVYNINSEVTEENMGYAAGITLKPGPFKFAVEYRDVQKDCSLADFVDSDFGGGGTNADGIKAGASYKVTKHIQAGLTFFANNLYPANTEHDPSKYYRFQGDLKFKF